MNDDEWGRDPSVRLMRSVFAAIEAAQNRFLDELGLSRIDKRLRRWRETALHLFEQAWRTSVRAGMPLSEKDAADLYLSCLARVLRTAGVEVPARLLPDNPALMRLLGEKG